MQEETLHFSLEDPEAETEWVYSSPYGSGSYRADEQHNELYIAMFHQLHCLRIFRRDMLSKEPITHHSPHCLNYLRESFLCESDTTLEPGDFMLRNFTQEREGITLVCRDWRVIYEEMKSNWVDWYRYLLKEKFSSENFAYYLHSLTHIISSHGFGEGLPPRKLVAVKRFLWRGIKFATYPILLLLDFCNECVYG